MRMMKKITVITMALMLTISGVVVSSPSEVQAGPKKNIVKGVKKYKKRISPQKARKMLGVPNKANVTITYGKKSYHTGVGAYEIPVQIKGRGVYRKYLATANFSLSVALCCSILIWTKV